MTMNFSRRPFLISAGDRYLLFGTLTPSLYSKLYVTVLQHLVANKATTDDDCIYTQLVVMNKPYSVSLRNKHTQLSQLSKVFSDGQVKVEAQNKIVQLNSISEYLVLTKEAKLMLVVPVNV